MNNQVPEEGSPAYHLEVSLSDFKKSLCPMAKIIKFKAPWKALLSFSADSLVIDMPGGSVTILAKGEWPGTVQIAGKLLFSMARSNCLVDPLKLRVEGERLYFGASLGITCSVDQKKPQTIPVPLNATAKTLLNVRKKFSAEDIERAGITNIVLSAVQQRDVHKKFEKISTNTPLEHELIQSGLQLTRYYVEGGLRKFSQVANKLIEDLGESAIPYLKSWYAAIAYYPGLDTNGMEMPGPDLDKAFLAFKGPSDKKG